MHNESAWVSRWSEAGGLGVGGKTRSRERLPSRVEAASVVSGESFGAECRTVEVVRTSAESSSIRKLRAELTRSLKAYCT